MTRTVREDLSAALTVLFLTVPQALAYATIAGLPPAMGLYAAAIPTIVASIFRSSSHVVAGPSNALSLLVGEGIAVAAGVDPVLAAITLAAMVGLGQVAAGALRLGAIVDFVSRPVVLGYITGAGVLIGVGQLPNLTATEGARGDVLHRLAFWIEGLGGTSLVAVAVGLLSAAAVVALRRVDKRWPGAIVVLSVATLVTWLFDLRGMGLHTVGDAHPVPMGLPPSTWPDRSLLGVLSPLAGAAMVLSLIESAAVARSIAARTGERLNISREFVGQGLGNVAAGLTGGYPISGSLSRSAVNELAGARSRWAGVYTGLMTLSALLFLGPAIDFTPTASLAGLLLVIAWDLVDRPRIRECLRSTPADKITFLVTVLGTWSLRLDYAIYVGVALSMVMFLRQARLVTVSELRVDEHGGLHEVTGVDDPAPWFQHVRIANIEGRLFFAVEAQLRDALDDFLQDQELQTLVLRLKRTQGMDVTVAAVLRETAARLAERGGHLVLAGFSARQMRVLRETGALAIIGEDQVFPSEGRWFAAFRAALEAAAELADEPLPDSDEESESKARLFG